MKSCGWRNCKAFIPDECYEEEWSFTGLLPRCTAGHFQQDNTAFVDDGKSVLDSPELMEVLASIEHDRWASWQQHVFDKCTPIEGYVVIPGWAVEHWQRQINTPYEKLSDHEKAMDREQVLKYLPTIKEALAKRDKC